jgi:hypothetical protein
MIPVLPAVKQSTCLTKFERVAGGGASPSLSACRKACPMWEGKIDMAATRQVTNKLRGPYAWSILFDATLPPGSAIHESAAQYRRALIELGSTGTREVLHAAGNTDALDASLLTDIWLSTVTTVVQWWLEHPEEDAAATTQRCVRLLRTLAGSAGSARRPRT